MKKQLKEIINLVASARADLFHLFPFDEHIESAVKKLTKAIRIYQSKSNKPNPPYNMD